MSNGFAMKSKPLSTQSTHLDPAALLWLAAACISGAPACSSEEPVEPVEAAAETGEPEIIFPLGEEASAYRKLVSAIDEQDANDGTDHLDQRAIVRWVAEGSIADRATFLFDHGDELSTTEFTPADGVGSLVTASRFSRYPNRGFFTGPNASSCGSCHDQPRNNGAGRGDRWRFQRPQHAERQW
jgi:hypothetical protein